MKSLIRAGLVAAIAIASQAPVQATTSGNWAVKGSITPQPCNISLSGGGLARFRNLSATTVQGWGEIDAPQRYSSEKGRQGAPLALQVLCAAPAKFALYLADNRSATVAGPAVVDGQNVSFGLGRYTPAGSAATNIGRYTVRYDDLKVRSTPTAAPMVPVRRVVTPGMASTSSTWSHAYGAGLHYLPANTSIGFTTQETVLSPDPLVSVEGVLLVNVEPLKQVVDQASTQLQFDGSATLALVGL